MFKMFTALAALAFVTISTIPAQAFGPKDLPIQDTAPGFGPKDLPTQDTAPGFGPKELQTFEGLGR